MQLTEPPKIPNEHPILVFEEKRALEFAGKWADTLEPATPEIRAARIAGYLEGMRSVCEMDRELQECVQSKFFALWMVTGKCLACGTGTEPKKKKKFW